MGWQRLGLSRVDWVTKNTFLGNTLPPRKTLYCMCVPAKLLQSCPTLCDSMDYNTAKLLCAWNFPGKNSGVDCHPFSRGSSDTEIELMSPTLPANSLPFEPPGKPYFTGYILFLVFEFSRLLVTRVTTLAAYPVFPAISFLQAKAHGSRVLSLQVSFLSL